LISFELISILTFRGVGYAAWRHPEMKHEIGAHCLKACTMNASPTRFTVEEKSALFRDIDKTHEGGFDKARD
jgi:hypothetical protein